MDHYQWQFLQTDTGQRMLAETVETPITESNHLQIASRLREQIDPPLA